ncbi:MAG: site-specific tyrosine recombinase/integron integrase [Nanoarchaeota archaeon]
MFILEKIKQEGLRRRLSPRTIKTYCFCVNKFLKVCRKELKLITKKDVEDYLMRMINREKAGNTINVHLNALKFLFEKVLKRNLTVNIPFSKVPQRLPEFLTKEETSKLFQAIGNSNHQLMIKLLYATGMRVSELVSLKVKDFQFDQNYGWVREGKGQKDRLFIIAEKLKNELLNWIKKEGLSNPDWLFSGNNNSHYSTASVRSIIKQAAKKAGIKKNVHPHTLRHSFATHLIQNGYAVTEVQPLLGHNKMETTMMYLHLASPQLLKVKSPYDHL